MRAPRAEPRMLPARAGRTALALVLAPALLWLDRGAAAAVVEALRADLWLTDLELGLVVSAPALLVALAAPACGVIAPRARRRGAVVAGVLLWSATTFLAAAARGHATLLVARTAGGMGIAAAVALAPGLGDDLRGPAAREGRWRTLAIPLACAAGYALAGVVGARLGWRAGLRCAAAVGLLVAVACARTAKDAPPGDAAQVWGALRDDGFGATARRLLASPGVAQGLAGLAAYAFGTSALAFWLPAFLERVRGVPRRFAGLEAGVALVMAGIAGTIAGSAAVDALRARGRRGELWAAAGATTVAGAALVTLAIFARRPVTYLAALVLALLLLAAAAPAILAAVGGAAAGADRAAALALAAFAAHSAADAPAAAFVGAISDARSLWWALLAVPVTLLLGGVAFGLGAWRGRGRRTA